MQKTKKAAYTVLAFLLAVSLALAGGGFIQLINNTFYQVSGASSDYRFEASSSACPSGSSCPAGTSWERRDLRHPGMGARG